MVCRGLRSYVGAWYWGSNIEGYVSTLVEKPGGNSSMIMSIPGPNEAKKILLLPLHVNGKSCLAILWGIYPKSQCVNNGHVVKLLSFFILYYVLKQVDFSTCYIL